MSARIVLPDWSADDTAAAWNERTARPGYRPPAASFDGRRVLSLESRRAPELALLVMNYGGRPVIAPALREVALDTNTEALAFATALIRREFDLVVLMTGVGVRLLLQIVEPAVGLEPFVQALAATRIVARGPKPVAALREIDVAPWAIAPKPNTWHEVLAVLETKTVDLSLGGARVAIQEYGAANPELASAMEVAGATVTSVPVYRWTPPEDLVPLRDAVHAIAHDEIDVVLLTAPVQLVHLMDVASATGAVAELRAGLARLVIASIGPMTSHEIRRQGLQVDVEPSNSKMGVLVKEAAEQCERLLHAKPLGMSRRARLSAAQLMA